MIHYLLQATVGLGLFYAFYFLVLRKETFHRLNRAYLLSTLLAGIMIPLVPITWPPVFAGNGRLGETLADGIRMVRWPEILITDDPTTGWDWNRLVLVGYGVIGTFLLLRFLTALWRIHRLQQTGHRTRINGYEYLASSRIHAPFSFGRTIFLPDPHGLSETDLGHVLRHEHKHLVAGHTLDVLFMELVKVIFWPVPVLGLYSRALREVHEYEADAEVLRHTGWEPYTQLLVSQRQEGHLPAISHHLNYSQLKNRIRMMHRRPSSHTAMLKYAGLVPLVAVSLAGLTRHSSLDLYPDGRLIYSLPASQPWGHGDTRPAFNPLPAEIDTTQTPPEVDQLPVFPTCDALPAGEQADCTFQWLYLFVADHLKYPEHERLKGMEGRGIASFVIGADGLMRDIRLVEKVSPGIDAEILRIMEQLRQLPAPWIPAKKDGKPVAVEMKLPILFKLS